MGNLLRTRACSAHNLSAQEPPCFAQFAQIDGVGLNRKGLDSEESPFYLMNETVTWRKIEEHYVENLRIPMI